MPKAKQQKKIKVPANAPTVLVTLNRVILAHRQEIMALIEAGQAYAKSIRLDPATDYRFESKDGKVYAIAQEKAAEETQE